MNILPPVPTPTVFNVGTVNTEAVRRDNTQREAVPQLVANEKSAAETAVGSEADKVKPPGQAPPPLTYEKPVPQTGQQFNTQNDAAKDNGQDASAGKENAEEQQQKKQQQVEQQVIEFKQRDSEVRAHEQAHASLGGQYATQPEYEYERGPDGRRYAVSGEVSIDISKASTPEALVYGELSCFCVGCFEGDLSVCTGDEDTTKYFEVTMRVIKGRGVAEQAKVSKLRVDRAKTLLKDAVADDWSSHEVPFL